MKFPGSLAAACLAVLVVHAAAAPVPIMPARTPSPTPPIASGGSSQGIPRAKFAAKLGDSTLARLYFGKGSFADITKNDFTQALGQLELPPGPLTPENRTQVLDLLLQKKLLSTRAAREPRGWTHEDSVNYRGLLDRLTLRAALDSALAEAGFAYASRGDSVPDRQQLGILVRESAMERLNPVYDDSLAQRIADAFLALPKPTEGASIQEQIRLRTLLPSISREDSARALIVTNRWTYTAGELLVDFSKLNRVYRPDVRTADDVRGAVDNVIYEKLLRENVVKQDLAQRPWIAGPLAQRAEYLDAQAFVRRNAYDKVPTDTATVRRHFDRHPRWFETWGRADIVRGVFATREEADSFAKRLALPGVADSLATQTMPNGMAYATYLTEDADTALFRRVRRAGVKGVVGPDETVDGWRVFCVMRLEPRRSRTFAQAFDIALSDWYQRDGDRRVNELMRQLTASAMVQINEPALASMSHVPARRAEPPGSPGARRISR